MLLFRTVKTIRQIQSISILTAISVQDHLEFIEVINLDVRSTQLPNLEYFVIMQ